MHFRFSIASTHVVPRSYIDDPLVIADIQRREERCRQNGGIGTLVVIIQCGTTSQVMPFEVDPPAKISWGSRDDWAPILSAFVESGRTDFKPISTIRRGSDDGSFNGVGTCKFSFCLTVSHRSNIYIPSSFRHFLSFLAKTITTGPIHLLAASCETTTLDCEPQSQHLQAGHQGQEYPRRR